MADQLVALGMVEQVTELVVGRRENREDASSQWPVQMAAMDLRYSSPRIQLCTVPFSTTTHPRTVV